MTKRQAFFILLAGFSNLAIALTPIETKGLQKVIAADLTKLIDESLSDYFLMRGEHFLSLGDAHIDVTLVEEGEKGAQNGPRIGRVEIDLSLPLTQDASMIFF